MRTTIPGLPAVAEVFVGVGDVQVASAPAVQPVPPVVMSAKSTQRLGVASSAWHYYTNTGQTVTNSNMHYYNVLKDFHIEWKSIESMAKESKPDVPVITKGNSPSPPEMDRYFQGLLFEYLWCNEIFTHSLCSLLVRKLCLI